MRRLVGHLDMQRLGVRVRIDGDAAHTHPARRADHTASYLSAIGDQDLAELGASASQTGVLPTRRFLNTPLCPAGYLPLKGGD